MELRITGNDAALVAARLTDGLDDADFSIPGQIVADIALVFPPSRNGDGSIAMQLEALTIVE